METLLLERKRFDALPKAPGAALIVGNPAMPPGVPQLPGAELEAKAIAGLFGAEAVTGPRATKAAVLGRAPNSRIIHLATHGLLNSKEEQMSSIVLAPQGTDSGFLPAREIGNLELGTELAVLSACNTGQGKVSGDGVVSVARSFVEAGVPSLVVSLWSIPDAPTSAFMVDFYKDLKNGRDKAQSLRDAMLSTMARYPEPSAWAAFILIGVPEASAALKAVHGNPQVVIETGKFTFPVPPGETNYHETLDSTTREIVYIDFETSLTMQSVIKFYSGALAAEGITDDGRWFLAQGGTLFIKRFHDSRRNRDVEVTGSARAGNLSVRVGFEKPE
jgi:CHAT domain